MELKEFISETLQAVIAGVSDAQEKAKEHGAFVNPTNVTRTTSNIGENATWDKKTNNITQQVKFSVAITVEDKEAAGAKIGVVSSILNLGANADTENRNQSVSHISFNVPVMLPPNPINENNET